MSIKILINSVTSLGRTIASNLDLGISLLPLCKIFKWKRVKCKSVSSRSHYQRRKGLTKLYYLSLFYKGISLPQSLSAAQKKAMSRGQVLENKSFLPFILLWQQLKSLFPSLASCSLRLPWCFKQVWNFYAESPSTCSKGLEIQLCQEKDGALHSGNIVANEVYLRRDYC